MYTARLIRGAAHPSHGTFGMLTINGKPICNILEPYSRDNEKNISNIPANTYLCEKRWSALIQGWTFEITDIQGRDNVIFHWGNLDDNTEGCLLTGSEFGTLATDWAVLGSKKAFKKFMAELGSQRQFLLTITDNY